jgi:ribosome recycling factor
MYSSSEFKKHLESIVNKLKEEMKTVRTGQASPALLENLQVETYSGSTTMRLMEMATITTDGPTMLVVVPFDPSTISDVEKAILKSPLGLSPTVQNNRILVQVPKLSQEQREKYVKIVNTLVEEHKQSIRGYRDDARRHVKHAFEAKEITEDQKFRDEKEIDEITAKYNEHIQEIKETKEKQILQV